MSSLRRLVRDHRLLAGWLFAAALLMRVLVPSGFMPVATADGFRIVVCTGVAVQPEVAAASHAAMPGMTHHDSTPDAPGHDMPCGFAGLSMPSLGATDPVLLALAIAFVLAVVFGAAPPVLVARPTGLRPPLRGPPRR